MSSMYRAAQKLYTSATAPSKKQKAKQEGWRVENLAAAPSPPQEDDVDDADAEPEPVPPRVWDKYRRYRESASRVIAQLRIE